MKGNGLMNAFIILVVVFVIMIFLGWLGLQIQPTPFAAYPQKSGEIKTIPLPQGLPAPVRKVLS